MLGWARDAIVAISRSTQSRCCKGKARHCWFFVCAMGKGKRGVTHLLACRAAGTSKHGRLAHSCQTGRRVDGGSDGGKRAGAERLVGDQPLPDMQRFFRTSRRERRNRPGGIC